VNARWYSFEKETASVSEAAKAFGRLFEVEAECRRNAWRVPLWDCAVAEAAKAFGKLVCRGR